MTKIAPAQLLVEVEDVLRTMPPADTFGTDSQECFAWLGRASAVVAAWNPVRAGLHFDPYIAKMNSRAIRDVEAGTRTVLTVLNQARYELRMQSIGPMTISVTTGAVFDYFDELRKAIEVAKTDLLFVDPYLDAEFVSRYLPHTLSNVPVRLLGGKRNATLLPAVALLRKQTGAKIEVRSASGFHDRYLFVDRTTCYHSGASFKDGAKKAPTTLTEIVDAFPAVLATYEQLWSSATIHP